MHFENYRNTEENFNEFHKQALNTPRENFSHIRYELVQEMADLLLYIYENRESLTNTHNIGSIKRYKYLFGIINYFKFNENTNNIKDQWPKPFDFNCFLSEPKNSVQEYVNFYENNNNDSIIRNFRHLMSICKMFNLIKKIGHHLFEIDTNKCTRMSSNSKINYQNIKSELLNINVFNNECFKVSGSVKNVIESNNYTNQKYEPIKCILEYLRLIDRNSSVFEISYLFGLLTKSCISNNEVIERALDFYSQNILTDNFDEHKFEFFDYMNWKDEENYFDYNSSSQRIHFKFKVILLFMDVFKFINLDTSNDCISLSE